MVRRVSKLSKVSATMTILNLCTKCLIMTDLLKTKAGIKPKWGLNLKNTPTPPTLRPCMATLTGLCNIKTIKQQLMT